MSYKDFKKFSFALEALTINWITARDEKEHYEDLSKEFSYSKEIVPSLTFKEQFDFGLGIYQSNAVRSEEMRKIQLIWPFLEEIWKRHLSLYIWSGVDLNSDEKQGLTGRPDYFVTKKEKIPKIPYCVIVEAKKEDFDQGWGQTLSAMRGAQILNQRKNQKNSTIYGIVTDGIAWQFGKLKENDFIHFPIEAIDVVDEIAGTPLPEKVLGLLDVIFSMSETFIV